MHPIKLHFAAPKTLLITGAATTLVLASASTAYAATLDTSATMSTSISTPSVVSIGDNSFNISVTATGNLPSSQPGIATVTTKYFMAGDGTITASANPVDQVTLHFPVGTNYSTGCTATTPPLGCPTNPFVVAADLVVAAGTPGGVTGTLTIADQGSSGLSTDPSPAAGYVKVAESNHAPTMPGTPTIDASSTTPNNTGAFTIDWAAATDPDNGDTVTYTLQKRDADDTTGWTDVATGLTTNFYSFTGEPEGSWRYQVQAVDNHGASSGFATDGAPIVVVDTTAPNPPTMSLSQQPAYTDNDGNHWFKDAVTVTFAGAGDPDLADGSAGSGIASVSSPASFSGTGPIGASGHATDNATNVSTDTVFSAYVDSAVPTVAPNCPTATLLNADAAASWSASDEGSGLATPASGSVTLDTSTVGDHTVTIPAAVDNVGHSSGTTDCTYHVGYGFGGFLQPINDTAHFVGETTSVFKAGSTVPVKFQLLDASGVAVQASSAPIWFNPAQGSAVPSSTAVDESTYDLPGSSGSVFKWDATSQQYVFNYKTDKSQAGHFWRIGVKLDDGSTYYVSVALR